MAHGVVCEKNLDTNDEYFVSLCWEEGGKCIGRRSDPILPFFVLAILLLQDRDALLFARAFRLSSQQVQGSDSTICIEILL